MRDARIEYLIHLVEKSDISELEVWEGWGRRIRIVRQRAQTAAAPLLHGVAPPAAAPAPAVAPSAEPARVARDDDGDLVKVASPMVGTFYRAASPDAPPFVEVGAQVSPGQTLCIIEAMKLMNEIASEVSGSVRRVLVENGQPVEFGQPLFLIEPSA
jgi:acetyl-CoA carboxylase biotin carboxyl carrier protein